MAEKNNYRVLNIGSIENPTQNPVTWDFDGIEWEFPEDIDQMEDWSERDLRVKDKNTYGRYAERINELILGISGKDKDKFYKLRMNFWKYVNLIDFTLNDAFFKTFWHGRFDIDKERRLIKMGRDLSHFLSKSGFVRTMNNRLDLGLTSVDAQENTNIPEYNKRFVTYYAWDWVEEQKTNLSGRVKNLQRKRSLKPNQIAELERVERTLKFLNKIKRTKIVNKGELETKLNNDITEYINGHIAEYNKIGFVFPLKNVDRFITFISNSATNIYKVFGIAEYESIRQKFTFNKIASRFSKEIDEMPIEVYGYYCPKDMKIKIESSAKESVWKKQMGRSVLSGLEQVGVSPEEVEQTMESGLDLSSAIRQISTDVKNYEIIKADFVGERRTLQQMVIDVFINKFNQLNVSGLPKIKENLSYVKKIKTFKRLVSLFEKKSGWKSFRWNIDYHTTPFSHLVEFVVRYNKLGDLDKFPRYDLESNELVFPKQKDVFLIDSKFYPLHFNIHRDIMSILMKLPNPLKDIDITIIELGDLLEEEARTGNFNFYDESTVERNIYYMLYYIVGEMFGGSTDEYAWRFYNQKQLRIVEILVSQGQDTTTKEEIQKTRLELSYPMYVQNPFRTRHKTSGGSSVFAIRESKTGRFKDIQNIGRCIQQDKRRKAKRKVKSGQGFMGDVERGVKGFFGNPSMERNRTVSNFEHKGENYQIHERKSKLSSGQWYTRRFIVNADDEWCGNANNIKEARRVLDKRQDNPRSLNAITTEIKKHLNKMKKAVNSGRMSDGLSHYNNAKSLMMGSLKKSERIKIKPVVMRYQKQVEELFSPKKKTTKKKRKKKPKKKPILLEIQKKKGKKWEIKPKGKRAKRWVSYWRKKSEAMSYGKLHFKQGFHLRNMTSNKKTIIEPYYKWKLLISGGGHDWKNYKTKALAMKKGKSSGKGFYLMQIGSGGKSLWYDSKGKEQVDPTKKKGKKKGKKKWRVRIQGRGTKWSQHRTKALAMKKGLKSGKNFYLHKIGMNTQTAKLVSNSTKKPKKRQKKT